MTPDEAAVLADTRLSREARLMALYVAARGPGGHEISHETWRHLLGRSGRGGPPKDDTIAGYVAELRTFGWVDQDTATGRGHSPRYEFRPPSDGGPNQQIAPLLRGGLKIDPPPTGGPNEFRPPPSGGLNAPSSSSLPLLPLPPPLDARARAFVIQTDCLIGCRDSLLDYLADRVEPGRQLAYAQTVAGLIEGTDEGAWMARNGSHVRDGRQAIVAGCLNELRQGDEIGKYFPGPPGDVKNLRSKIRYRVKSTTDAQRDAERSQDSPEAPGATRGQPRAREGQPPRIVHVER